MADEWKIKTPEDEWSLKEEGPSLTSQILEEGSSRVRAAGGGLETVGKMIGSSPGYVASGITGATLTPIIGATGAQEVMEGQREYTTLEPKTEFGKLGAEAIGAGVEKIKEFVGEGATKLAKSGILRGIHPLLKGVEIADENLVRTGAEITTETALNLLPITEGIRGIKSLVKPKELLKKSDVKIPYDSSAETSFPEMQAGKKQLSGQFDTRLTTPDMPGVDWDTATGYSPGIKFEPRIGTSQKLLKAPELKLRTIKEEFERQQIVSSQGDGIPFREMTLEDPKAIEFTQSELAKLSVKADVNETRLLISQMKGKMEQSLGETKRMFYTITNRIKPIAIDSEVASQGYKAIHDSPMAEHIELVPTQLMELMRHTDRLTNPEKGFLDVERSVLKGGVNKGVSILYWPEEGRIVQDKRNVVRSIAAKHGIEEIPAFVRVMSGRVPDIYSKTAVSIPGLIRSIKAEGQWVKPSDVGLPSRSLNEGVFNPRIKYAPVPTVSNATISPLAFFNEKLFFRSFSQKGLREGFELIAQTSKLPFYRKFANLLLSHKDLNPGFRIQEVPFSKENGIPSELIAARYDPNVHEMSILKKYLGQEYYYMHEGAHAITASLVDRFIHGELPENHPTYRSLERIQSLYVGLISKEKLIHIDEVTGIVKELDPKKLYQLSTMNEFIAHAFSDVEFQNMLRRTPLPDELRTPILRYYWDQFLQDLLNVLGLSIKDTSYLSATLRAGAELMAKSTKQDRMYFPLRYAPEHYWPATMGAQKFGKSIRDAAKELGVDRRPLQEAVENIPESFKDMTDVSHGSLSTRLWAGTKAIGRELADAKTIALLNKELPGMGLIMKNLTDRVELTNRWVRNMVDVSMIGERFGPGKYDYRKFIHRQGGPDGVKTALRSLSEKELKETMVPWLSNNGKRDLVRTDFATDRSYEAFNSIQATFDRALAIDNSLRAKFEMSPIPRIPGFFPRSRANGDYRLTVADQAGDIKQLLTFKTLGEAKEQYVYLKEKFPYLRFDNPRKEQGPYHREPYKTRETETSVLVEALRINSKDDAVTKLITQAINERILKRGAGGHFLKRKEGDVVGGYLGENLEVNDIIQGIESYHELLYTNSGNLQKRLIQQELNDLKIGDKLFSQMAPNAYSYLTQYLNKARGASNLLDQSETIFAGKVSQALGYGASGAERAMQSIASGAMMWYLTKMPFFGSQFFQPFNALAKMIDVAQTYSGKGLAGSIFETTKAFMLGYQNTIYPKIDGRNVVNWAIKAGYIDPMMAHLLDPASDVSAARKAFTKTSGTIEREVVRIPVLLGFNELLRNVIKNPEKRYEAASELMSRTMAMTSRSNAPMIWDRFGIVGTAMKSLKSYSTNIWGQFSEFLGKGT